jgi:hypothetical protein
VYLMDTVRHRSWPEEGTVLSRDPNDRKKVLVKFSDGAIRFLHVDELQAVSQYHER